MNKFKKIMLGALSVLTLGLFVATGAKANASTINRTFNFDVTSIGGLAGNANKNVEATDAASSTNFSINFANNTNSAMSKSSSGASGYLSLASSGNYTITLISETAGQLSLRIDTRGTSDSKNCVVKQYTNSIAEANLVTTKTASTSSGTIQTLSFDTLAETTYKFDINQGSGGGSRLNNYIIYTDTTEGEAATFTVKYDLNGGKYDGNSTIPDDTGISSGTNINLPTASKMTKEGMEFDGWKLEDGTLISADTLTYKVIDNVTLTAVFNYGALTKGSYTVDPSIDGYKLTDMVGFNTVGNACTVDSKTLKFSSGSGEGNSLYFTIPSNTTADLTIFAYNGSSSKTSKFEVKPGSGTAKEVSFSSTVTSPVANNFTFSNTSENDLTIYIYRTSNSIRMSKIELIVRDNSSYDSVQANLLKQFDDDTNPTKLRLIGEIKGIAFNDYANISSIIMSFDFNGNPKTKNCTCLYKSVATIDNSLSGGTNTMYAVVTIKNVNNYVGQSKSFKNVKMTIVFEDGSSRVLRHSDIAIA